MTLRTRRRSDARKRKGRRSGGLRRPRKLPPHRVVKRRLLSRRPLSLVAKNRNRRKIQKMEKSQYLNRRKQLVSEVLELLQVRTNPLHQLLLVAMLSLHNNNNHSSSSNSSPNLRNPSR